MYLKVCAFGLFLMESQAGTPLHKNKSIDLKRSVALFLALVIALRLGKVHDN